MNVNVIAITVSVNYEDYLKLILDVNHKFFKKWYIVTKQSDTITQDLCKQYPNVEVILFEFRGYGIFNKGGALKKAQQIAHEKNPNDLFLILDSDIVLPENFTQEIEKLDVQENSVYGTKRRMIPSIQDYLKGNLQQFECRDWQHKDNKYWHVPWGYFQLYKTQNYYSNSNNAQGCDTNFSHQFKYKLSIPMIVDHVGPEATNWNGRVHPKEIIKI